MRPKIVIGILLLGAGLLVVILLASKSVHSPSTASVVKTKAVAVPNNPIKVIAPAVAATQPVFSAVPAVVPNDPAAHAKYVRQRIKELNELAMNNDVESRDIILSEVATNSDRRIRAAALEAAIQFDDRSVVPKLQQIAAQTDDPQEKQSILDAVDYINLPSLTEYRAANPADPSAPPNPNIKNHPRRIQSQPAPSPDASSSSGQP
jgi:hypothetical protein